MSTELRLPQIADPTTAAKIGAWLKREGDAVAAGEVVVEVETDKTNVEVEAPVSGFLERILVPAGTDGVLMDTVLALIGEGKPASVPAVAAAAAPSPQVVPVSATAPPASAAAATAPERPHLVGPPAAPSAVTTSEPAAPRRAVADVAATPLARQIARLAGLDLSTIAPTDGRRITRADVERALGRRLSPGHAVAAPISSAPLAAGTSGATALKTAEPHGEFTEVPLTNLRRVTAARLQQAKQQVPHFYLNFECRVDGLMALRARWNGANPDRRMTITDLIVFAASRALREVPQANSAWADTGVRIYADVDLAIAVNTPKGLITPIVRACQKKTLPIISREIADLAARARDGRLAPAEYTGATFTISNLGMFGVTSITPIVNPPAACILGVGAIESRAVVEEGRIVPGHTLSCTLAADHRAIDGATGAEFMAALRKRIEEPFALSLEG